MQRRCSGDTVEIRRRHLTQPYFLSLSPTLTLTLTRTLNLTLTYCRHAQRYFLCVDPKQPFSVPRAEWG
jgi:hypothetical protein